METDAQVVMVPRGAHELYTEMTTGVGAPIVLMHGFPDNLHLYDRLLPYLVQRRPVVRFDFLGWGRSDKPSGYAYTAANQAGDLDAVVNAACDRLRADRVVLVAHDASGPPAIDWALAHPSRVEALVLLNTYYHWTPALRRPPAIALYSTPIVRTIARAAVRTWPELDRRLYWWQVGGFVRDPEVRQPLVAKLYEAFGTARPAFWRLNDDLLGTVLNRRKRINDLRHFQPRVQVIFGVRDPYLNARVAKRFATLFPNSELHLIDNAGHFLQVDEPELVARLITE